MSITKCFPRTMGELHTLSTMRLLSALIIHERNRCTNVYAPKTTELNLLLSWVERNVPHERDHEACKECGKQNFHEIHQPEYGLALAGWNPHKFVKAKP